MKNKFIEINAIVETYNDKGDLMLSTAPMLVNTKNIIYILGKNSKDVINYYSSSDFCVEKSNLNKVIHDEKYGDLISIKISKNQFNEDETNEFFAYTNFSWLSSYLAK